MPENNAAKRLKKWNPLKLFKGKVPEERGDLSRAAYTAYRREQGRSPEAVLKTMSYEDWRKTRKKAARPGR